MTAPTVDNPLEAAAHANARRGWAVVPVHHLNDGTSCSCVKGSACHSMAKHPRNTAWGEKATTSGADVAEIWQAHPAANVGIATGTRSGVWVLDVDDMAAWTALLDGRPEPETFTVKTGSGGRHYYFSLPDFTVPTNVGKLASGIDLRADGGMVVAPPSVSAKGRYEVLRDVPVAPAPDWLLDRVRDLVRKPAPAAVEAAITGPPTPRGDAYARAAVESVLAELDGLPRPWRKGAGWDSGTFNAACTLVEFANSGWCSYTFAEARRDLFAHAPRNEAWGVHQHHAKIDSAVKTVGGKGRVLPPSAAREGDPFAGLAPATTTSPRSPAKESAANAEEVTGHAEVHSGQARMAYRLAASHSDRLLFVTGIGWHFYDGTRWSADDRGAAKRAVLEVLRVALAQSLDDKDLRADVKRCESAAGVAGVLDLASALVPFAATVDDLDADPYLFNAANGTLDLRTGVLRPHQPGDRMTKVARAAYEPGADGGSWDRFLAQVLPDAEVRGFLQRVAGVALVGLVLEHVLVILTGTGANGKGTAYKAINHSLGDYASTAEPDLFMHRQGAHPTGEMDLLGVRLVVVSESEKDRRLAEATMKRLTGGDTIRARRMRQDFVEFTPSHTAVLVTNHLPKVSGDDPAIWRRLRVVPFDVVIPEAERDVHLDERLQLDADAILSWAVSGYADYVARRGLNEPKSVLTATSEYQKSSDAVARFVDEECVVLPTAGCTTSLLHTRWTDWARRDGADDLSSRAFGEALDRLGFPAKKGTGGARIRRGIGLAANETGDER